MKAERNNNIGNNADIGIAWKVLAMLLAAFFCISCIAGVSGGTASAAEPVKEYTTVAEDLLKDEKFKLSDYPQDIKDYSVQLIQIAESGDGELFLYVYMPNAVNAKMAIKSVNISLTGKDNPTFRNYKLTELSRTETLIKCRVDGLTVSAAAEHQYNISNLLRAWIDGVDDDPGHGNEVSEVGYEVGEIWTVRTSDGGKEYIRDKTEVITVTDKFVGFVRYPAGFVFLTSASGDCHFIAFDTDRYIQELEEADVSFSTQEYTEQYTELTGKYVRTYGDIVENNEVTLKYTDDKVEIQGNGLFAPEFKYDTIQTVDEFLESIEDQTQLFAAGQFNVSYGTQVTDEMKESLKGKKWVLRFTATPYEHHRALPISSNDYIDESVIVGDTLILRLQFKSFGVRYNLGVVDKKQTGSAKPWNPPYTIGGGENAGCLDTFLTVLPYIAAALLLAVIVILIVNMVRPQNGKDKGDKK